MSQQVMGGPSDKAVEAARVCSGRPGVQAIEAAHQRILGLDRSVCLRDVVEKLRLDGRNYGAAFIEREFQLLDKA